MTALGVMLLAAIALMPIYICLCVIWMAWMSGRCSNMIHAALQANDYGPVDAILADYACTGAHMWPTHWLRTYLKWRELEKRK